MGDHQGRPDTVNLGPFISMALYLWPIVYSHIVRTRVQNESNQTKIDWLSKLLKFALHDTPKNDCV